MKKAMLIVYLLSIVCLLTLCSACEEQQNQDGSTSLNASDSYSNNTIESEVKKTESTANTSTSTESTDKLLSNSNNFGYDLLDEKSENFMIGSWTIEKLLGFTDHQNDRSEYPKGQQVIGKKIIINNNLYSSMDLGSTYDKYKLYGVEIENPKYLSEIDTGLNFCNNNQIDKNKLDIKDSDTIKSVHIVDETGNLAYAPMIIIINNDRVILSLDSSFFEMQKVK